MAHPFDDLAAYGAAAIRLVPVDGPPQDLLAAGGDLEAAFERLGQGPLADVLRDPRWSAAILQDGDLSVGLHRQGEGGRLVVAWAQRVVVDELVDLPAREPAGDGPWFRPDPASRVVRLDDVDPSVPLVAVDEGGGGPSWYAAGHHGPGPGALPLQGVVPGIDPSSLGSAAFRAAHGVRWAYVAGAMAGGIASVDLVRAMCSAGLLSFYGSGGLGLDHVERDVAALAASVDGPWGVNLLHNPMEPAVEEATVDLFLRYGVRAVEASAFMGLTAAIVRYRVTGLSRGADGAVACRHRVMAKVSRIEVASRFLRPAPDDLLKELVARGAVTAEQAALASEVPMADDVTVEADSGGHTDHRPLVVTLPALLAVRDAIDAECGWSTKGCRPRIGAAGGLGTPVAVWAAFAMGADYVVTGSVNQSTREAGTSADVKVMLAEAAFHDVASGPAPDMFEIGAKVQVLARGSMYAQRAQKLHDLYKRYDALDAVPTDELERLEKTVFKRTVADIWAECERYWGARDPEQIARAAKDGRHKMALVFRWYLGMTSRWARVGDSDRKRDFQIWCGPAMGGFNQWAQGGPLQAAADRTVVGVGEALMRGAAVQARRVMARHIVR